MTIFNHSIGCIEVSSIVDENISGDYAEIGWVQIVAGVFDCNATGDGTPRVQTAYITANTFHCFQHGHLTDYGQQDSFYVWGDSGSGGSYPWTWEHNGAHPQLANLDFRLGIDITNGERLSNYDSAQSEFHGLLIGHDSTWNPWAGASCDIVTDPSYSNKILSSTQVDVSTAGTTRC
jgi:hypothetical protein